MILFRCWEGRSINTTLRDASWGMSQSKVYDLLSSLVERLIPEGLSEEERNDLVNQAGEHIRKVQRYGEDYSDFGHISNVLFDEGGFI